MPRDRLRGSLGLSVSATIVRVPLERTDSDLDDVWSDAGELDDNDDDQLTEFEFRAPKTKKKRPPMISDLEVPVLGDPPPSTSAVDRDVRTMIGDAEGAAIAHVVARSVMTTAAPISVPDVLERDDVKKVLVGHKAELVAVEEPAILEFKEPEDAVELTPMEDKLELAFDPHIVSKPSLSRPAVVRPVRQTALPLRGIVMALLAIVTVAFVVRFFLT
jgi:hypothetical protein